MRDDYYELLGLGMSASRAEITSAFRRLSLKLHPDKASDAASALAWADVREAYAVLSDPAARRRYDERMRWILDHPDRVNRGFAAATLPAMMSVYSLNSRRMAPSAATRTARTAPSTAPSPAMRLEASRNFVRAASAGTAKARPVRRAVFGGMRSRRGESSQLAVTGLYWRSLSDTRER
mmetsp:Transcript_63539/g.148182  ORF Transcript_63539/g.148182 Transcript_63539/m.148182 type:complete len:179 (-) Transcript_63539:80-616(-)